MMKPKQIALLGVLLLAFGGLMLLFVSNLNKDPSVLPSTFIDQPAPQFDLPILAQADANFRPEQMLGQNWVLNVWASWCVACRLEHAQLLELQQQGVTIVGLNYKDTPQGAQQWLRDWHDPYQLSVVDADGRAGIDYGVYGVPESFIIDANGIIRAKHTGPIMPADMPELLRQYKQLEQEQI